MPTLREYKAAVHETYPLLSKTQVQIVASKMASAGVDPSPWNITETIVSGRAPDDGFRVCVGPRHSRCARGGADLDPRTIGDQRRSDPTANHALRNDRAAARRLGLIGAGA